MSEPTTPSSAGGWTSDTLLSYLKEAIDQNDRRYEQRFKDLKAGIQADIESAKDAVIKAENATEKRFENVNEFRASLNDAQRTFMPRAEAEARFISLDEKLSAIIKANTEKIAAINLGVGERRGQSTGVHQSWVVIVGIAGIIGMIVGLVTLIMRIVGTK